MITVAYGSATDVGRVREVNEDAVLAAFPVFVVADGMGGYEAGDIASRLTVEQFAEGAGRDDLDRRWAEGRIAAAADAVRPTGGGTTVTGIVATTFEGIAHWLVFNVGDSRVYRRTGGEVVQVSVDHSLVQEMVDSGMLAPDEARHHPERNIVTRAIGADDDPVPDFWLVPATVGDRFLVCSDGLTGEVEPPDLAELLCRRDPPQQVADRLVAAAVAAGGRDNITVVVVDVVDVAAPGAVPAAGASSDPATGGTVPDPGDAPSSDTRPFTPLTPRRSP
ncbi:PP2C family protein-serine/threonine phosphatase [Nakamurella deserti]|uniref:PP2C family protein-serine/threonine phosphatase n=1 Tax=Nakamurella deserti TaxID=2164074 RepID=UPI0013008413|nr:protein phosphatase 2C domain-containing protein [Nakamurella deserti]